MSSGSLFSVTLDIGCGNNKMPGAIGLDKRACKGVNVISDFEQGLPFKTGCIKTVFLRHVIEHVDDLIQFMEELFRVCQKDAKIIIEAPYYSSRGAFRDPTHRHFISEDTFQYFEYPTDYGTNTNFKIESIRYDYRKPFRYFPEYIRKRFRRYFLNVVDNLYVTLRAVK